MVQPYLPNSRNIEHLLSIPSIPAFDDKAIDLAEKAVPARREGPITHYAPNDRDRLACSEQDLRELCCRLVGWTDDRADLVNTAVTALLAQAARGTIALRGASDLVPIAYTLHRALFGLERPFVVCDPRRRESDGSVRSPPNRRTGALAAEAAAGGSVCLRARRLPRDFSSLASSTTTLFICLHDHDRIRDRMCPPIEIPSLAQRTPDRDRLLDEYLEDAAHALGVDRIQLSPSVRRSIAGQVTSLAELEKTVLRVVALLSSQNLSQAAERLHMAPVSLSRWASRRHWAAASLKRGEVVDWPMD